MCPNLSDSFQQKKKKCFKSGGILENKSILTRTSGRHRAELKSLSEGSDCCSHTVGGGSFLLLPHTTSQPKWLHRLSRRSISPLRQHRSAWRLSKQMNGVTFLSVAVSLFSPLTDGRNAEAAGSAKESWASTARPTAASDHHPHPPAPPTSAWPGRPQQNQSPLRYGQPSRR